MLVVTAEYEARLVGFFRDAIASKLTAASSAQMETTTRAAAERKSAMESLAVAFERTVGEIVHLRLEAGGVPSGAGV